MQSSQQEKPQDQAKSSIPTVFLKAFELTDEEKLTPLKDVETPLVLVEGIEDFKENTFWLKIRNIWSLIGKVPPLSLEENDLVLFRENGKWGLFKFLKEEDNKVFLRDAKDQRTTKVPKEALEALELFGKILRVQDRV